MTTTLYKTTETSVKLDGVGISMRTFITRMGRLGYDTSITEHTLHLLSTGGKWVLNFTTPELKYLTKPSNPKRGGGIGF